MNERIKPEHIKRARKLAKLSLGQASAELGIQLTKLARIEEGLDAPSPDIISAMSKLYGVTAGYLNTGKPKHVADFIADGAHPDVAKWRAVELALRYGE